MVLMILKYQKIPKKKSQGIKIIEKKIVFYTFLCLYHYNTHLLKKKKL